MYQQLRVTGLNRVRGGEGNGQQTGGTRDGELSVPAAQEIEKQVDERKKKKRGEKASEKSNSSERGTKRMRATDEEHVRNVRNQREQAAKHGGRSSDTGSVMHSVQHAPTCNITTTTIPTTTNTTTTITTTTTVLLLLPLLLYIPYLPYPNCVHVCVCVKILVWFAR